MKNLRCILLLSFFLFLTACNMLPPNSVATQKELANQLALDALSNTQRILNAPIEEQRREITQLQQAFQREKSVSNRLQLGLLLAMPTLPNNDDARALTLLEPLGSHPHPAVRSLANLVNEQIQERQRLEKKSHALLEQLEELKAMERSLIERSAQPPPMRKKP